MKNLLFISVLFFFFSCGGESKTEASTRQATNQSETIPQKNNESPVAISSSDNETQEVPTATIDKSTSIKEAEKEIKTATKMESKTKTKVLASNESKAATTVPTLKETATKTATTTSLDTKMLEEKIREEAVNKRRAVAKAAKEKAGLIFGTGKAAMGSAGESTGMRAKPEKPAFSHAAFDALLRKHVSASGKVNYRGFKKDEAKLNEYLLMLSGTPVDNGWSRSKKMAYWINAYNAHTIKLIVKNYPVASITKLHGGKPWDAKWIKLNGKTLSLNNIENDILRPKYKDARIHFAVNCAAQSCPPLLNRAWTAKNLNANFEKQAKAFINNPKFNVISSNRAEVSKIFEWYAKDFGNLTDFLNKYSTTKINTGASLTYKEYDWKLNE